MKYGTLIDSIVPDSGDTSGAFRTRAMTWINLIRAKAAKSGNWRSAVDPDATLTTDPANTTGIYELDGYEQVVGTMMFDVTQNNPIRHDAEATMLSFDPDRNDFGPPMLWTDAGMSAVGNRQIRFFPIPQDARTIKFVGQKIVSDISSEDIDVDPYFGPVIDISPMLHAGLRYHMDLSNNEDAQQVAIQRNVYNKAVRDALSDDRADPQGTVRLDPVGRRTRPPGFGRLDPAHFSNS